MITPERSAAPRTARFGHERAVANVGFRGVPVQVDIHPVQKMSEMQDRDEAIAMLRRVLSIDAALASRLVDGHLFTIEDVAYVPFAELKEVCCLSEAETTELREAAQRHLLKFE
jgi:hypothetical protein